MHLALLALLAASAPPAPAPLTLPAPPAGAAVDGDLAEWPGPPVLSLAPAAQVAGSRRVRDDADFSARVWLALGPDGLWLAADVRDDAVRFPKAAAELVTADHLELWVALPAPALPPVAFANQFEVLETPGACKDRENAVEDRPACLRWHEAQLAHRERLSRLFVRQYLLSPLGVTEAFASAAEEVAPLSPACCGAARVAVKQGPGGWRLEAWLPLEALPATGRARLDELRVLVDAADADKGRGKLEAFVTSAPGRRFGEPDTFHAARAAAPIPLAGDAPQPEARFRGDEPVRWAVFPARPLATALVFENLRRGYQHSPEAPSPEVTRVPLATRPLARAGDLTLVEAAVGGRVAEGQPGPLLGLVALRGEQVAGVRPLWQGHALAAVADGATARALVVRRGSSSLTGSGACGACEVMGLAVVELAEDGTFRDLWTQRLNLDDVETSEDGLVHVSHAEVIPIVEPGLGEVGLAGVEVVEVGSAPPVRRPFAWRWRWDGAARRYEPTSDAARARERAAGR
jgi:hypothetical protein